MKKFPLPTSRREFLSACAATIPILAGARQVLHSGRASRAAPSGSPAATANAARALLNNRFLTFASVVRVNNKEFRRGEAYGGDERAFHTPETIAAYRYAFGQGWPGGRMTWALTWMALTDTSEQYKNIRRMLAEFHKLYGDEITFNPGGFYPNVFNTREQVNRDLHDGIAMASAIVGGGYRPKCVIAGFLAAENQKYLAEHEGIHVCQGNIWSDYGIDFQDGDGSICYPFYPSIEHFCKPAQGKDDFIDCVCLDGFSCDFLAARRPANTGGYNSRMGVGPIETIRGLWKARGQEEMLFTTALHFDKGFELNGFAWVTNIWEVVLGPEGIADWLSAVRERWPDTQCITHGEFGMRWREHYKDNSRLNYRFVERGSGIWGSDADKQIRWFMNQKFRLALMREWPVPDPEKVIDFTRYDLPAHEPQEMSRKWSLMQEINQKQTRPQDKPRPLKNLSAEDQKLIVAKYPELASQMKES